MATMVECSEHFTYASDRRALKEPYDVIYHQVWDKLHADLFGDLFTAEQGKDLGKLFVDLCGFVASRGKKGFIALPGHAPKEESLEKRVGRAFGALHIVNPKVCAGANPSGVVLSTFKRGSRGPPGWSPSSKGCIRGTRPLAGHSRTALRPD
jgi:hypothetical protein